MATINLPTRDIEKGSLVSTGVKSLGIARYEYFGCVSCGEEFPSFDHDQAMEMRRAAGAGVYWNYQRIKLCPYCRPADYANPASIDYDPVAAARRKADEIRQQAKRPSLWRRLLNWLVGR